MAIEIQERFSVPAPIGVVWQFLMDPQQVVTCMPGASLDEVVSETEFLGSVQVRLGAVATGYKGRVRFTAVDEAAHRIEMLAEGRESGGGTARAVISSQLTELPEGGTEILAEAKVDLTGRIVQVGRGMIQGVSHQLFQQFAASAQKRLEQAESSSVDTPAAAVTDTEAIRILPLVLQTLWSSITGFFRRLLGRTPNER